MVKEADLVEGDEINMNRLNETKQISASGEEGQEVAKFNSNHEGT
jgi:hypothetical protein